MKNGSTITCFLTFSVGETTFLKNVFKLPPASILNYDIKKNTYEIFEYASNFEVRSPLLDGDEGLEYASEIFAKQLPKYYPESSQIACALTNGWDGRTVLIFSTRPLKSNCVHLRRARMFMIL